MNDLAKDSSLLSRVPLKLQRMSEKVIAWAGEEKFKLSDLFFLGIYGAIVWFGILHHEPWSDEALPWIIARDTDWRGFLEIIFRNWDFHPGLFHALLLPFVKLGFPYFTQQVLNALFALAAAGLFITQAPFSRVFRVLFLFCFYMIYEYSVITRPYMLTVALIFALAAFHPKREKHPFFYALLISLLFHADYMGFGIGAGLTLVFFIENVASFKKDPARAAAFAWMALNGLLILWVASSTPPGHGTPDKAILFNLQGVIRPLANAFLPFWDLGAHVPFKSWWALFSGVAVLSMAFVSLIGKRVPAVIFLVSLTFLFSVFSFFYFGDTRNHGFILISVIFCLWIGRTCPESVLQYPLRWQKLQQWATRGAVTILGISFLLGIHETFLAYVLEYHLPFSGAKAMAQAIKKLETEHRIFEQGFVIVAPHKNSVGLMPYLPGVKFWSPCTASYGDYYKLTRAMASCNNLSEYDALQITKLYFGDLSRILLLFRNPLPFSRDGGYEYQKVYAVPNAFGHWQETFFLYRPLPKAPSVPPAEPAQAGK